MYNSTNFGSKNSYFITLKKFGSTQMLNAEELGQQIYGAQKRGSGDGSIVQNCDKINVDGWLAGWVSSD